MSNALPAREPSMDEILASIRKIIESGDERISVKRTAVEQRQGGALSEAQPSEQAEQAEDFDDSMLTSGQLSGANDDRTGDPALAEFSRWGIAPDSEDGGAEKPRDALAEGRSSTVAEATSLSIARLRAVSLATASERRTRDVGEAPLAESEGAADEDAVDAAGVAEDGDTLDGEPAAFASGNAPADELAEAPIDVEASEAFERDDFLNAEPNGMASVDEADDFEEAGLAEMFEGAQDAAEQEWEATEGDDDAALVASALENEVTATEAISVEPDYLSEFDEDEFAAELLGRVSADLHLRVDAVPAAEARGEAEPAAPHPQEGDDTSASGEAPETVAASASSPAENAADRREALDDRPAVPEQEVPDLAARQPKPEAARELVSREVGDLVAASFDDLARAVRDQQLRTLSDTAESMLRPMLQEWLDDNLPKMVERLVREEIERVARGGRR